MSIRVGILMGGTSREREVSFAGGRTVYDNLDKTLFTPVPLFVDARGRIIELNWRFLYKGTIRDFFPPKDFIPAESPFQYYAEQLDNQTEEEYERMLRAIGTPIALESLPRQIDVAFLALHGRLGEDGTIQGLLEWLGIPYTGSGLFGSTFGLDKSLQRTLLNAKGFASPKNLLFSSSHVWQNTTEIAQKVITTIGLPCVVKHPTQGSSIGVRIVKNEDNLPEALRQVAFRQLIDCEKFKAENAAEQFRQIARLTDLREGLGLPLLVSGNNLEPTIIESPDALLSYLRSSTGLLDIQSVDAPANVLVEEFIDGTEFSVIVIEDENGNPLALPPTEIRKGTATYFDYRSKYLPGMVRKVTPIELPDDKIRTICKQAEALKLAFRFDVYARLDGILALDGTIYFNDPNTTSGMLPGSFFFHQAAEIGLTPSAFLTYIIHRSLHHRAVLGVNPIPSAYRILRTIESHLLNRSKRNEALTRIAVILGGYSSERHISVESGRNIFEKLNSSGNFAATPVFLIENNRIPKDIKLQYNISDSPPFSLWEVPVNYILKDNSDDIADKIIAHFTHPANHPVVSEISEKATEIRKQFAGTPLMEPRYLPLNEVPNCYEFAFLGLHGRPGEDGQLQQELEKFGVPYNGSSPASAELTIDKYATNERLRAAGVLVADHRLVAKSEWVTQPDRIQAEIEMQFGFPLIAKPQDDGCSSAVQRIDTKEQLAAFLSAMFRDSNSLISDTDARELNIKPNEEFPAKPFALIETMIAPPADWRQMEVTVGFLTHSDADGNFQIEVLEPSEALSTGKVLSLEEKFLAGEGQNITPARFSADVSTQAKIASLVKSAIEKTAKVVGAHGYGRIDAFAQISPFDDVRLVIIEVNSLPGMTPATCIFHQAAENGYSPHKFIEAIISEGKLKGIKV